VTEAGDGEDGRIKSAIGIGSLLSDGIGDTIRVSLTEDSVHEIPVAKTFVAPYNRLAGAVPEPKIDPAGVTLGYNPFEYRRRASQRLEIHGVPVGGDEVIRVFTPQRNWDALAH